MIRNEDNRIEMHPLPQIGFGQVFIIGESVSFEDIQGGNYNIGEENKNILDSVLMEQGLCFNDCVYSVAIPFILNKAKTITPTLWKKNQERLWKEIESSGAKIVMPLGVIATQILLNDKRISVKSVLGNIIEKNGVRIIPNYHPSSLYHAPGNLKVFKQVMKTVSNLAKNKVKNPGVTKFTIINSSDELEKLIEKIKGYEVVAVDIETSSLTTWKATIWNIGICIEKNMVYVIPHDIIYRNKMLIQSLFFVRTNFIWHNGKYDTSVLAWNNIEARVDHDTILLHYCINETTGTHGLGPLATLYLAADEYKSAMNSEFNNIKDLDSYYKYEESLAERVAIDTDYTLQLYNILKPVVYKNVKLIKLYLDLLLPASKMLTLVEISGVKIDKAYLEERVHYYKDTEKRLLGEIDDVASFLWNKLEYMDKTDAKSASDKFNPNSVQQLKYIVWDVLKLRPTIKCKRGETGKEVLESIPNPPQFLKKVLELRTIKKEYSTYCKNYLQDIDEEDIIHASFSLISTVTGRLSCTKPNLQNIPSSKPDVRRMIIPREKGRVLMEVDYSSAELRVLAWISEDKKLEEAVVNGDLHSEVAKFIFGDGFSKQQRGMAKAVNFGIIYGITASSLAESFGYTKEETQQWIDDWAKLYPNAWRYLESCVQETTKGIPLTTPWGRIRRFGLISSVEIKSLANESKNFRIQSISSDNTLMAAIELQPKLINYGAYVVNLIHDSILIDCPGDPDTVNAIATITKTLMETVPFRYYGCFVPFKCDVDIGVDWGTVSSYDIEKRTIKTKSEEMDYIMYYNNYVK